MNEKQLNEQESLELITRMIQNSKKNLGQGGGNAFLLWGYVCAITALVVFAVVYFTKEPALNWLWFAIPVVGFPLAWWQERKRPPRVITYIDKVIASVWRSLSLFGICGFCVVLWLYQMLAETPLVIWMLMIPMSLIFCSLGSMITGNLLRDKWMSLSAATVFVLSFFILLDLAIPVTDRTMYYFSSMINAYPVYALCFVFMMIIPGHRLNNKEKKETKSLAAAAS
ncbi:MAG: hypothetical protein LBM62_10500 [Mediterranea sp.]|jgi:hypothetical protein|nr:hypothetical protein [Mediterranea sp.]